ncbi:hypothetical protein CEP51_011238 [Fusarium floridanum]|uniref:Zn(2)-C6 fungal-type domain-containing protein n=1 Tax=Fusarium floridanum TaxID=1325733 RepID=A0A428RBZ9_9HYPO|nr:hypothetical protein CEP51_011238 [Fusarium floridanum]
MAAHRPELESSYQHHRAGSISHEERQHGVYDSPRLAAEGEATVSSDLNPKIANRAGNGESGEVAGPRRKRRRITPLPPTTTDFTRRKRVAQACQFCRLRKTKCDNARPTCTYCLQHRARCIYDDEVEVAAGAGNESGDFSNGQGLDDGSSQDILMRLEEIKDMLKQAQETHERTARLLQSAPLSFSPLPGGVSFNGSVSTAPTVLPLLDVPSQAAPCVGPSPEEAQGQSPWTTSNVGSFHQTPGGGTDSDRVDMASARRSPLHALRPESLLEWAVFQPILSDADTGIKSFLFESDSGDMAVVEPKGAGRGIRDDAYVSLCRKFLTHVHPRNPLLDEDTVMGYARDIEENGLRWDGASCLVLLACALATYTKPWRQSEAQTDASQVGSAQVLSIPAIPDSEGRPEADAYFTAAKKRLGLLGCSIQDSQCFFIASIYEKYCLRPIQAWLYIQQASSRLQAYLLQQGQRPPPTTSSLQLEQRIFWSCFRAESEFHLGIGLPSSGLEELSYPDAFPAPPEMVGGDGLELAGDSYDDGPSPGLDAQPRVLQQQRSWSYYLAEISLRRTIDDNARLVYAKGPEYWMRHPAQVVQQCRDSEMQISVWHHHLPPLIQFDQGQPPKNEFSDGLQMRFLEWREMVLRPVLYLVLHHHLQSQQPQQALPADALPLAAKAVEVCAATIVHNVSEQRHGGTWFVVRRPFSCACLIIAVALHPASGLLPPPNWRSLVKVSIQALRSWGCEAPDLDRMAGVLENMYHEACRQLSILEGDNSNNNNN